MEKSFVFNSINGDRKYKAEDFREYFASFIGNGVFPNPSSQLQVITNNNMSITIRPGKAWVNGAIYINTEDLILNVDVADGVLNRIDRVVVRFDNLNRSIQCFINKGQFSSTPIAPNLQRDADAYELCIAEIRIDKGVTSIVQSKITDTKLDANLCGIVTQTVKTIDTAELYNKLQAYIDERGQDVDAWVTQATTQWGLDFNTWFNTIKDILDGDIAGALANRILNLENTVSNLELTDTKITLTDTENLFGFEGDPNINQAILANKTSISELNDELVSVKQSASDGKSIVASAITGKGVPTLATDTFQKMADNITNIKSVPEGWDIETTGEVLRTNILKGDAIYHQIYGDLEKGMDKLIIPPVTGGIAEVDFDSTGDYCFIGTTTLSPFINIYKVEGDNFIKQPNPDILPPSQVNSCSVSRDGKYLVTVCAGTNNSSTGIYLYTKDDITGQYKRTSSPSTAYVNTIYSSKLSDCGKYLAMVGYCSSMGYYWEYLGKRNDNGTWKNLLDTYYTTTGFGPGNRIEISKDSKFVYYYGSTSGYRIMRISNDGESAQVEYGGRYSHAMAFSNDGTRAAIYYSNNNDYMLYMCKFNSSGVPAFFVEEFKMVSPIPDVKGIAFSPDDSYIVLTGDFNDTTKRVSVLSVVDNKFTQLPQPNYKPLSGCYRCAISPKGTHVILASTYSVFYKTTSKNVVTLFNTSTYPLYSVSNKKIGVAMENKNIGEQISVTLFPKLNIL